MECKGVIGALNSPGIPLGEEEKAWRIRAKVYLHQQLMNRNRTLGCIVKGREVQA